MYKSKIFDPFSDFDRNGYLRNTSKIKDIHSVKQMEHALFLANILDAMRYLEARPHLDYQALKQTHAKLFEDFYPWAGKDREETNPTLAITKGRVAFAHPKDIRRSVEYGLDLATRPGSMPGKAGEILGLLAFAHPFLDGNGRAIMIFFGELCRRAGFSIDWHRTRKDDYLTALTDEIENPAKGILDQYLYPFVASPLNVTAYAQALGELSGLSGMERFEQEIAHGTDILYRPVDAPEVIAAYSNYTANRPYLSDPEPL